LGGEADRSVDHPEDGPETEWLETDHLSHLTSC